MSADTIVPGYTNPQNLNRYSYVSNNPLRYVDPTGHSQCQTHEDCEDMGTTPMGTGNSNHGNGGHHDDDDDDNAPTTSSPLDPDSEEFNELHCFNNPYFCGEEMPTLTTQNIEAQQSNPNPVISLVGVALTVQLGILDTLLSIGVASVAVAAVTVPGAQIDLVGELVLIPLDFVSFNLTIFAAQMAATGTTDHDPLPILHAIVPNIAPYTP